MARWQERPEETYRFAVQSFFEPTDFLRTLRDWILFYVEDGETRKSVLRQHQRRAVKRIVKRCAEPAKQRGLIWHTQGSGKTFTLLTAARLILERKDEFRTPTVVVVVDRTELEGQLKDWIERLLGEMQQQDIIESNPDKEPVLLPLKERAESILKELENRQTTGLAAMNRLADLAAEKDAAIRAARDSGLAPRTFAVHWALKDDAKLKIAGIDTLELAQRAEMLLDRFPNAAVNADEQRRLRTALYAPLLRCKGTSGAAS